MSLQNSVQYNGKLISFGKGETEYITDGPRMNVYRATIDNDMYKKDDWMNKVLYSKACRRNRIC